MYIYPLDCQKRNYTIKFLQLMRLRESKTGTVSIRNIYAKIGWNKRKTDDPGT
ncbi:hypothetical protein E2320_010178, partial [Naja naja]